MKQCHQKRVVLHCLALLPSELAMFPPQVVKSIVSQLKSGCFSSRLQPKPQVWLLKVKLGSSAQSWTYQQPQPGKAGAPFGLDLKGRVYPWHMQWGSGGSPKEYQSALTGRKGSGCWARWRTEITGAGRSPKEATRSPAPGLLCVPCGPWSGGERQLPVPCVCYSLFFSARL